MSRQQLNQHPPEDAFMLPPYGAQPVPVKEWVAANDNVEISEYHRGAVESWLGGERGQYIGLTRSVGRAGDPNGCADDLVTRQEYRKAVDIGPRIGPFIQLYSGRQFFPMDPRPEDVHIEDIAHGLANICRYSGATIKHYSVAEHSVLIARWLLKYHGPVISMHGLLHDAPEALSGFGDVGRPMKGEAPIIKQTEDRIWSKAIAPRFGLMTGLPDAVHEADNRIIADELVNLRWMEWHGNHKDPLGVELEYWSPDYAETSFLELFVRLERMIRGVGGME